MASAHLGDVAVEPSPNTKRVPVSLLRMLASASSQHATRVFRACRKGRGSDPDPAPASRSAVRLHNRMACGMCYRLPEGDVRHTISHGMLHMINSFVDCPEWTNGGGGTPLIKKNGDREVLPLKSRTPSMSIDDHGLSSENPGRLH